MLSAVTPAFEMKDHALFSLHALLRLLWPASCAWMQASQALTETSAKQLLLQWQNVKTDALGNHALVASQLRHFLIVCASLSQGVCDRVKSS